MDRRHFVRLSGLGGMAAFLMGRATGVAAGQEQPKAHGFAGSVYYTAENPGRWSKKVGGHMPVIQIQKEGDQVEVKITTPHEMNDYEHYIVKHVLFDQNKQLIGETLFDPTKDKAAISTYQLKNYSGKLYAVSLCNKHDAWLGSASV